MIELLGVGLIGFFLLVVQKLIYDRLWMRRLTVSVSFDTDHIFEGEESELKEVIENKKRLPLVLLKVKFRTDRNLLFKNHSGSRTTDQYYRNDMFRVGGGERVTRRLKFSGGRRGYYTIDEISLVSTDLFFLSQMLADKPVRTQLYVYPRPYDSSRFRQALVRMNGEMLSRRRLLEDPFEYRGIREYQPYDDMRSINWKATAKSGNFMVNQRNYSTLRNVRIFFNIQDDNVLKKEEWVEMSLRIVASLCVFFLKQGIQVACYGNGVDILTHDPVSIDSKMGQQQMDAIYKALARIDTAQQVPSFGDTFGERIFGDFRDAFTCFVAPNQYEDFVDILTRYKETGRPFFWFYPVEGKKNPKLPPLLAENIEVIYSDVS